MNWKIESKVVDVYELGPNDTQKEYLVYVVDATGTSIAAKSAYGLEDRTNVTRSFIKEYGQYIDKIEHRS